MEGEGRTAAIAHIDALDGARGLAVAGVLLYHGGHLTGGYLGVDLFFTLSGFLITSLLLAESGRTGSVGLGGFWSRRARRLLPALAVLMLFVALYCVAFASRSQLSAIRGDALATIGYVANWHEIFSHQSYFALFTSPSPLAHTWSLAIEEQFYLIWPLLFVVILARFKRTTPKAVLVTALVLAAASSTLMIVLYSPTDTNRAYLGTDTRAAAILLGAALAAWLSLRGPTTGKRARITLEVVGLVGAVFLAFAWARLDGQSSRLYQGGFLLCGLAATAVIAAAVQPVPGPLSRALSIKPLCALGLISYGVYLYHWPIDVVLDQKRTGFGGWPLFAAQTVVTLAVAIASYRIVEQPIRHGALSSVQWRKITPAITIGLVVIVFVSTIGGRQPAPFNTFGNPVRIAAQTRRTAPADAQRVMIVGDSVAAFLGQEIASLHTSPPIAVFNDGQSGCVFPSGIKYESFDLAEGGTHTRPTNNCNPAWEARALKAFRPQVVLWIVASPANRLAFDGRWNEPCDAPYDKLYERDLRREIAALRVGGARVVITTTAYAGNDFVGTDQYTDCNNRLARTIATATGAQLVDLFSYMCPDRHCRTTQHGLTLRPDGIHYQGPGGKIVAQWLIDQVRSEARGAGLGG